MASRFLNGAANETRTRYLHLGKVALYQMSYVRICSAFLVYAKALRLSSVFQGFFTSAAARMLVRMLFPLLRRASTEETTTLLATVNGCPCGWKPWVEWIT